MQDRWPGFWLASTGRRGRGQKQSVPRHELRRALDGGVRKVVMWTDTHQGRTATFPVQGLDPFFNVNTPDDLAKAETLV